jgi:phage terminase large subunit-like protein
VSKEQRAEAVLIEYEAGRVVHSDNDEQLKISMCAFPKVTHDDDIDAITSGILEIRKRVNGSAKPVRKSPVQSRY